MIAVEHLTKRFGKNLVLDDISETIEQGEKVVIIGPSGSGKSTFPALHEPAGDPHLRHNLL